MKKVELITLSEGDKFRYENKEYEVRHKLMVEVSCFNLTEYKSERLPRYLVVEIGK